jgi:hypothetical protein
MVRIVCFGREVSRQSFSEVNAELTSLIPLSLWVEDPAKGGERGLGGEFGLVVRIDSKPPWNVEMRILEINPERGEVEIGIGAEFRAEPQEIAIIATGQICRTW